MTFELKQIVNSYRQASYSISNAGQIKNKHSLADIDQLMVDDLIVDKSNDDDDVDDDYGDIDNFIKDKEEVIEKKPSISGDNSIFNLL